MFPQSKSTVIACSSGGVSVLKEFLGSLSSAVFGSYSINVIGVHAKLLQSCLTLWEETCFFKY